MLRRRLLQTYTNFPCFENEWDEQCTIDFFLGLFYIVLIVFAMIASFHFYHKFRTFLRRCFCRGVQWPLIISKEEVKRRVDRQVTSQLTCLTSFQEHYFLELRKYYENFPKICGFPESVHIECSDFDAKDDVVGAKFITDEFKEEFFNPRLNDGVKNPGRRYLFHANDLSFFKFYDLEPVEYRQSGRNELVCTRQNQREGRTYPEIFSQTVKDGGERTGFLRFYHFTKNRPVYPGYKDGGTHYLLVSSCDSKTFTLSKRSTA